MQDRNCLSQNILPKLEAAYVPEITTSTWVNSSDIGIAEFEASQIAQQIQIIELMLKIKGVEL